MEVTREGAKGSVLKCGSDVTTAIRSTHQAPISRVLDPSLKTVVLKSSKMHIPGLEHRN